MEYNKVNMVVAAYILGVIILGLLIVIEAAHTTHAAQSVLELRRRQKSGNKKAGEVLRREELLALANTMKIPLRALLLVGLTLLAIYLLGWGKGIVVMTMIALLYGRVASVGAVRRAAGKLGGSHEAALLGLIAAHEPRLRLIAARMPLKDKVAIVGSYEELAHVLGASRDVFSDEDTASIMRVLDFKKLLVRDVMTSRDAIVVIKQNELLGPLVLDDLHKTGHEYFPVIHGDVDHVIGVLDIRSLLALETKRSVTARAAMVPEVATCRPDQALNSALALLSGSRQPLLIVTDDEGTTVGLLSLGDIIEAMTGYKI